ncbi:hypothetical protein DSO57_1001798 [Entomophthora muscae]|uniref:Uncharacterized protein n=1 Tax=Entomophthora muscae TaxID=34485 RepID=A0ACC2U8I0_9FUNG|nr:hypothetical protein DSO57_1001798 [Entomophthora muscae]
MTTQELLTQNKPHDTEARPLHTALGHKSSSSLDARVFPAPTRESKANSRPFSDFYPEAQLGPSSNSGGSERYYSGPRAFVDQANLAPQLSNALKNGFPQKPPLKVPYISQDTILGSDDESLLRMLVTNTLSESDHLGVLPPLELERLEKEGVVLQSKISSLTTKLALEGKVMEGAQSLIRLHASNPKMAEQAQDQLTAAQHKVDQVAYELWKLHNQWWDIQQVQQQHHTAVLAMAHKHQQRELQRLWENMQLRLGQTAVVEPSFIEEGSVAVQDKLAEALDTIQALKLEIERLKLGQEGYQSELQEKFGIFSQADHGARGTSYQAPLVMYQILSL